MPHRDDVLSQNTTQLVLAVFIAVGAGNVTTAQRILALQFKRVVLDDGIREQRLAHGGDLLARFRFGD